jgi:hypothetical protein
MYGYARRPACLEQGKVNPACSVHRLRRPEDPGRRVHVAELQRERTSSNTAPCGRDAGWPDPDGRARHASTYTAAVTPERAAAHRPSRSAGAPPRPRVASKAHRGIIQVRQRAAGWDGVGGEQSGEQGWMQVGAGALRSVDEMHRRSREDSRSVGVVESQTKLLGDLRPSIRSLRPAPHARSFRQQFGVGRALLLLRRWTEQQ